MTPLTLAQIQTFTDTILLPTFSQIQQLLQAQQTYVVIATHAETGEQAVDIALDQMHGGKTYIAELEQSSIPDSPFENPQYWIGPTLYAEMRQTSDPDPIYTGQYCLSVEFRITPSADIYLAVIIGHASPGNQTLQIQTRLFADQSGQALNLQIIDRDAIITHFTESFAICERQIQEYEHHLTQFPEAETIEFQPELSSSDLNFTQTLDPADESIQPQKSSETPPITPEAAESVAHPFTLKQQVKDLSNQLSPRDFPIASDLNSKLKTPFQLKTLKNRHGQNTDLLLEYSLSISEADLKEQLSRLGHFESLRSLAHQHIFIQEKMQAWIKQNHQPSPGAIASHLNQSILQLRNALHQRITVLLDHQLKNLTAAELEVEFNTFNDQQHQQQAIFKQINQNAVLGYFDISLLEQDEIRQPHPLFTNPNESIQIAAQHLKNRDGKIILTLIDSCKSEKYTRYLQRKHQSEEQNLFVGYSITQKLYPNRPIFIGEAPKAVFPRLECLWGHTNEPTMNPNPLTQIWCIYPMIRTDPAQWIVIAATTDQQPLKAIALENGAIAQEGTYEYLGRSLDLMTQSEDEYTHALAGLIGEALKQKRVKYLHVHQTLNPKTNEPRDIVQMQFQLRS